jgi:hypothetical protein
VTRDVLSVLGNVASAGPDSDPVDIHLDGFDAVFIGRTDAGRLAWSLAQKIPS